LAFTLLMLSGIYPAEIRATNLDTDWFYRKGARAFMWLINNPMARLSERINRAAFDILPSFLSQLSKNPLFVPSLAITYARLKIASAFGLRTDFTELESRYKILRDLSERVYDEDIQRRPIGIQVLISFIFIFFYVLICIVFV
ncbi:MAG: hypothetical protein AAB283_08550, partial [Planctomycetota bacterium]